MVFRIQSVYSATFVQTAGWPVRPHWVKPKLTMPQVTQRECFRSKNISGPPLSPAQVSLACSPPAHSCFGPKRMPYKSKTLVQFSRGISGMRNLSFIGLGILTKYLLTKKKRTLETYVISKSPLSITHRSLFGPSQIRKTFDPFRMDYPRFCSANKLA